MGRPPQDPSELDWALVARELKREGVTLTLVWQEYRAAHPDGYGLTWVLRQVRHLPAARELLASWRRPARSIKDSASPAPIMSHQPDRDAVPIRDPETGHVISPVIAAALCMKPRSMLTISQARKVDALKQGSPECGLLRSLGMCFRGIFPSRDPGKLDSWIDDAFNSGLVALNGSHAS
ncbi:transposase [Sinorhizobium meliloti]|nr:transposase [Sinorhizobium meliloti]